MNIYGIPSLLDKAAAIISPIALVYYDVQFIVGMFLPPQWGIFKEGKVVVLADSIIDMSYRKDSKISTYPQQKGAFNSYNKVQTPFVIKLKMTRGGSDADRQEFIYSLDELQQSIDLFDIHTPEKTYINVNITGINWRRSSKSGVSLLVIDVTGEEIIDTARIGFVTPKNKTSNDPINGGTVQAKEPIVDETSQNSIDRRYITIGEVR